MTKRSNLDDIELFHERGVHVPSRTIYLQMDSDHDTVGAEVGPIAAERAIKNLHVLTAISQDPITIKMNCPGGNVADGMAIYTAIRHNPCHITIEVLGEASSMGLMILQAADLRVAFPFSQFMGHDGSVAVEGTVRDVEKNVEFIRRDRLQMYDIFAERTGKPKSYWARKMQNDYFMSAQQALNDKLIDSIVSAMEF